MKMTMAVKLAPTGDDVENDDDDVMKLTMMTMAVKLALTGDDVEDDEDDVMKLT